MKKEFDYYVYIDYSENLIGYNIIEKEQVKAILSKISKFHHYKSIKHKKEYISAIKKRFEKENIKNLFLKYKIREFRSNLDIFVDVIDFLKKNRSTRMFISIDDTLLRSFMKFFEVANCKDNFVITKESKLKEGSIEYKLSLIIDNMLNVERRKSK